MAEVIATLTKLLTVQEILEDASGATIRFQDGGRGQLPSSDTNYAAYLRTAQRSQERRHPVGVSLGEAQTILELLRADNDVPSHISEAGPDRVRVFFQGHDGVFCLKPDHPASHRIQAVLGEAIRQKTRVWFIAQKMDLTLLDVLPV